MKKAYVFMADGFEEGECLVTADLMRRGGIDAVLVSVTGKYEVTGRSNVTVRADRLLRECDLTDADALVVPGGQPGVTNLKAHRGVSEALKAAEAQGKLICAVCAGPTVLGELGLLKGKKAACYPGCEDGLKGADVIYEEVVKDGNFITSRGLGTTIPFALKIVESLTDSENAGKVASGIVFGLT